MEAVLCKNGHSYPEQHSTCPYCGVAVELGETKLLFGPFCGEHFVWAAIEAPGNAP